MEDWKDAELLQMGHSKIALELKHTPPKTSIDFYRQIARYIGEFKEWHLTAPEESWSTVRARVLPRYVPINLEERLHRLEESVVVLSEALLTRPVVSSTMIVDLNSKQYSLRHPIPIVVEEWTKEAIATLPETETYGSGLTPAEAINDLKEQIILLYEDLETTDPEALGRLPRAWRRILRHYVAKS
ncbi:MAG: hypothetical protein CEE40_07605 [Chloroflexi bacterium B3_Chlor]|nr:MAG: hypothetical protein CEE40_07605 [Chloroflexi bacterium B3_Chlor]